MKKLIVKHKFPKMVRYPNGVSVAYKDNIGNLLWEYFNIGKESGVGLKGVQIFDTGKTLIISNEYKKLRKIKSKGR